MRDVIYLVVTNSGVQRMNKNLPSLYKGEFPLKLEIEVANEAFRSPVLTKKVTVNDWREGIDIADVDFRETFITEQEAELIRKQRLARMQEVLEAQGYVVSKPEANDDLHTT